MIWNACVLKDIVYCSFSQDLVVFRFELEQRKKEKYWWMEPKFKFDILTLSKKYGYIIG